MMSSATAVLTSEVIRTPPVADSRRPVRIKRPASTSSSSHARWAGLASSMASADWTYVIVRMWNTARRYPVDIPSNQLNVEVDAR
jgi:hypothetical protein